MKNNVRIRQSSQEANLQLGKISHRTETAETLPNDTPFALILEVIRSKTLTNSLTVTNNAVSAEIFQIRSLLDGISLSGKSPRSDGRAETGTTLVEEQDLNARKVL